METTIKQKRFGVNRWIVLALILLSFVAIRIAKPVLPFISVAPEKLSTEPIFSLGPLGDVYLTNTLISLLIVFAIVLLLAFGINRSLKSGGLVPKGVSGFMELIYEFFYNSTESAAGKWTKVIIPWFLSIFIVVLIANLFEVIPGVDTVGIMHHAHAGEGNDIASIGGGWSKLLPDKGDYVLTPFVRVLSTDLNFTLAIALISVIMTQVIGVRAQGLGYFSKFINFTTMFKKPFFGFMDFIVGILELISEMAKIISFTFRLFGVMFSGFVLLSLVIAMVPIFVPSLIFFFELFMGVIQAFVFGMLTMVFMAMATKGHGGEEEHH